MLLGLPILIPLCAEYPLHVLREKCIQAPKATMHSSSPCPLTCRGGGRCQFPQFRPVYSGSGALRDCCCSACWQRPAARPGIGPLRLPRPHPRPLVNPCRTHLHTHTVTHRYTHDHALCAGVGRLRQPGRASPWQLPPAAAQRPGGGHLVTTRSPLQHAARQQL